MLLEIINTTASPQASSIYWYEFLCYKVKNTVFRTIGNATRHPDSSIWSLWQISGRMKT